MGNVTMVPFGKYKGMPIEVLSADESYREWLMEQEWFKARYAPIYNVMINNFGAPSETPEHNVMQAQLLDDNYATALLRWLFARLWVFDLPASTQMESEGFDGVMEIGMWKTSDELADGTVPWRAEKWFKIYIECKPMLGDDYPVVLRQMTTASGFTKPPTKEDGVTIRRRFLLVIGNYTGAIDWQRLVDYFDSRSVMIVKDSDILVEMNKGISEG